jgi:hypothetical protein
MKEQELHLLKYTKKISELVIFIFFLQYLYAPSLSQVWRHASKRIPAYGTPGPADYWTGKAFIADSTYILSLFVMFEFYLDVHNNSYFYQVKNY